MLGEHDAVLVDPPFTYEQIDRVGDWIARSGTRLAYIYATHGHGDHWFGADPIMRRFPGATAYATEKTIAMMHQQGTVGRAQRWDVDFPGLIPESPVVFEPIPAGDFTLEGHQCAAVEVGHTDTDDTTVLQVASTGLMVAGDVAYNEVHQYLLESRGGGIQSWLAALDIETEAVSAEVTEWFFKDYLPTWVGVGKAAYEGPGFILDFWGVPVYDYHPDGGQWALDGDSVTGLLNITHTRLRANGYAYTEVVDRSVRLYHRNGAAIEAIWSRRRPDDTEIERLAVHFEVIRTQNGWRIAGIQRRFTHAESPSDAWAAADDEDPR